MWELVWGFLGFVGFYCPGGGSVEGLYCACGLSTVAAGVVGVGCLGAAMLVVGVYHR
ncbi:hypothetical protein SLEP1_g26939 [Rubroshorea leprosula]|uniref:NADH dehydrogenase subunit 6 n=1 Tax=Rubroshorea leprosula TaxID=152421 RepID=A0AAV5JZG6_9ROSI|nr:hypothetical protein SLEP1_g26939 [Rubroshorea leprosula]